ncbi:hypothetical protein C4D60_Mb07t02640 [Musa balbisiana]|uniref:Uncharacterized protein n=1 Tax=Musa balbisiana TaxID=52838 RepID=A0A4S8JCG3_MUSBA|nr:hypothetical protein C4D60_Mb07t02640 [Musa balbisiana]
MATFMDGGRAGCVSVTPTHTRRRRCHEQNFPAKFQPLDRIEASAIVLRCRIGFLSSLPYCSAIDASSVLFHRSRWEPFHNNRRSRRKRSPFPTIAFPPRMPPSTHSQSRSRGLLSDPPRSRSRSLLPIVALGVSPRPTPGAEPGAGAGALPDRYDLPFMTCAIDLVSPTTMLI